MKRTKFHRSIILLLLLSSFLFSCDFIAAGSNLMAERYKFEVTQDSLIKKITAYNEKSIQDSVFKISDKNPSFYRGYINDIENNDIYWVLIPVASDAPTELLLISVENRVSGKIIIVNQEPKLEKEINSRKIVVKNFKNRVLDKIGLKYKHTGNAMNKVY
ncbi:hypothetical protein [Sphingobacterium multivorum]|uniref:Lipoprotein n=1 Tax=Sphingobacterium multivorum TaxID=28454 RepID=A0A2X2JLJ6_SPHMU|nr:hypothetical protein [Sphingobacterium multivorum]QRQ61114.1 hypothetical protein I6J33_23945 [Sphingobacterium multivorum]SPZ88295.1 Uncharacterised protein [Sphingobacterium multivorum]